MKSKSAFPLLTTLVVLVMLLAWLGWSPPALPVATPPAVAGKQADAQAPPALAAKNLKATAAKALAEGRFKNFDKRVDGKPVPPLTERQRLAVEALRGEVPDVQVDFDPLTGSPKYVVSTTRFLTQSQTGLLRRSLSYDEAMAKVKSFVDTHRLLFGHGSSEVDAAQVTRKDTTERSGLQTVVLEQRAMGVPVFQSLFKANLSAQGEIAAVASEIIADSKAAATNYLRERPADFITRPSVSAEQAVSLAANNVGDAVAAGDVQKARSPNPKLALDFFSAPGLSDAFARKVWLPMDAASLRLAWEVNLTSLAANESFTIVIDALSGEALVRQSRTSADTTPQYTV